MKLDEVLNRRYPGGYQTDSIYESPQMVPNTEFGLSKDASNEKFAAELLKKRKHTYEETDDKILFKTGDGVNGYIALLNKGSSLLDYVIKYEGSKRKALGRAVTQVMIWRRRGSPYVQGLTRKVFFEILLKEWPAIMSDRQQTEDGMMFWDDRMAEATTMNLKVGLFHEGGAPIEWFDGKPKDYQKWIRSHEGWGDSHKFTDVRYVISSS